MATHVDANVWLGCAWQFVALPFDTAVASNEQSTV